MSALSVGRVPIGSCTLHHWSTNSRVRILGARHSLWSMAGEGSAMLNVLGPPSQRSSRSCPRCCQQFLILLNCFAQMSTVEKCVFESELSRSTCSQVLDIFRKELLDFLGRARVARVGGANKIICVDETFITKRKRNRAGFQGRRARGHTTVILGVVELSGAYYGRKTLGRAVLKVLPDKTMESIEAVLRPFLAPGTTVWTDGNPSYNFLDEDPSFVHDKVKHRRGEFSKLRKDGVKVSILVTRTAATSKHKPPATAIATPKKKTCDFEVVNAKRQANCDCECVGH